MPRHCPECKGQMEDDTVHCWCPWCDFNGYVVLRTGKIIREDEAPKGRASPVTDEELMDCYQFGTVN